MSCVIGGISDNTRQLRAGDVLTTVWIVVGCDDKPKHGGGVVRMEADCTNQHGVKVAAANGAMLVADLA